MGFILDVLDKIFSSKLIVASRDIGMFGLIPAKHTCDGDDISPHLHWRGIPAGTVSIALICEDADSSRKNWVHWVLYDLPASHDHLPESIPQAKILSNEAKQGINDFNKIGYNGPCHAVGVQIHRYFFRVYACDIMLDLAPGITKLELLKAMEGHILAQGYLVGRY